ncbi:U6 snRNA phosphodiesterase Usb1 [Annulohypoxylon maeteangense]|uniref:U6 snRNA phosphodiesterase Usb1 n=1 Tax=Annulohypoxylon maeteangense TaxID=1927788 RepID=UPI0020072594|nr:U6 snRNA phosphodiesterase Usb1 [Annulohypoxylon maeteangense]KAI0882204.1 U6 snRNA phosphodiesterase Usb1 [Annulohypoxylon maeteangense]
MALVDYSSSDSDSADEEAGAISTPAAKKPKTSHTETSTGDESKSTALPPLPAAFHDLYASTVRVSTTDDPTLHQGRKRVNPHKAGNWPSHLYIEWHPTPAQLHTLSAFLSDLQPALSPLSVDLTSFLTSDLGAPQPLHISLSRPIVLSTGQKDGFLEDLAARVKECNIPPFELAPVGLEWHRTRESERSFLVLRVAGVPPVSSNLSTGNGNEDEHPVSTPRPEEDASKKLQRQNPQLTALLICCNALVQEYSQPPLYAFKADDGDTAFHISIAWSFAPPSAEVRRRTEEVFSRHVMRDEIRGLRVRVDGIKAKIGNTVTHVPLLGRGKRLFSG